MQNYIPQIGDIIGVNRGFYVHKGVYVPSGHFNGCDVIHNEKDGVVSPTTMANFSGGKAVYLIKAASPNNNYFQKQAIGERGFQLIGTKYDLINFNCDHAASYIQSGRAESPQLQSALFAACFIGLILAANRA